MNESKVNDERGVSSIMRPLRSLIAMFLQSMGNHDSEVNEIDIEDMSKSIRFSSFADSDKLEINGEEGVFLAVGVGSLRPDEKHVVFLDLDDYSKEEAESIAKELISKVGVSDCYIVRSSPGNHHLVTLDIIDFNYVRRIAMAYGHDAWAKFRGMNEDYVLRVGPKLAVNEGRLVPVPDTLPTLVSVVKSPFSNYKKSNALRRVFRNVWGYQIPKDDNFDNDLRFRFHVYKIRMVGMGKQITFKVPGMGGYMDV